MRFPWNIHRKKKQEEERAEKAQEIIDELDPDKFKCEFCHQWKDVSELAPRLQRDICQDCRERVLSNTKNSYVDYLDRLNTKMDKASERLIRKTYNKIEKMIDDPKYNTYLGSKYDRYNKSYNYNNKKVW